MAQHHGLNQFQGIHAFCHHGEPARGSNRFGRMFNRSAHFTPVARLKALGAKGGPMDGGATANRTNSVAVGQVFFGQFIDHDVTLDVTTSLNEVVDAEAVTNARTPSLDLDCVYGNGPEANPYLYHSSGDFAGVKLLTAADGTGIAQDPALAANDLSRSAGGTAIIGDPRNDENRIVSQLQLAMIRFHNQVVDAVNSPAMQGRELFEHARELTTWHYQWVVINDFLTTICGGAVVMDILGNGRKYYCADNQYPFIPVEFSVAAYRFGHSMVPQKIQIQKGKPALELFGNTLGLGFSPLSSEKSVVDWHELVITSEDRQVQMADVLNTKMATDLLELPFIPPTDIQSLATRNLLRGQTFLLPSGENIAHAMGRDNEEIEAISNQAQTIAGNGIDLGNGTPLWFYLLVEAEKIGRETVAGFFEPGEGLGPVGARIVAETLIGLIELDHRSFLAKNRNWEPTEGVGVEDLGAMLTYS